MTVIQEEGFVAVGASGSGAITQQQRCPQCRKVLMPPAGATRCKCPQCSQVMAVPIPAPAPATPSPSRAPAPTPAPGPKHGAATTIVIVSDGLTDDGKGRDTGSGGLAGDVAIVEPGKPPKEGWRIGAKVGAGGAAMVGAGAVAGAVVLGADGDWLDEWEDAGIDDIIADGGDFIDEAADDLGDFIMDLF